MLDLFAGTGAKSMADWLAQHSGTSHGETASKMKLANSMEKSPELSDAVDNGDISLNSLGGFGLCDFANLLIGFFTVIASYSEKV